MKVKKVVAAALAGTMCLSMVACGNERGENKESKKSSSDGLQVAIWDDNQQPGLSEILSDFTEKTGIKAEIQVIPWDSYWTLLEAGAKGGDLPDVFWMHSNYSQKFMANNLLMDLTDKIAESDVIDLNNYYQDIVGLYQLDKKTYAIPKDYDTVALWYNKKMFDEAGIAYPDETWTWEKFAEVAKQLTKEDGSQYGFASPAANNQDGYYNLIYDNGGYIVNEDKTASGWDDPKTIEAMKWFYDNVVSVSMPPQETMAENSADVLLQSGKVAMIMQGSWMVAAHNENEYTKENCDVAVLPMSEDGTRKSICNGLGWVASANTKKADDAWKLLEYLGSKEAQVKQAELGVTMSAYMGTSEDWIGCAPQFNLQAYLDMTKDMVIRPYTKNTKNWEDYSQETMVKVFTGEIKMEDACKDIASYMNDQIEAERQ